MDEVLLTLITVPDIEETLVDWLLARDDISGFSSGAISGHGTQHARLSMAEQVSGRQRQALIQIQAPRATAETLLEELKRDFAGTGIHYWMAPLLAAGHLE